MAVIVDDTAVWVVSLGHSPTRGAGEVVFLGTAPQGVQKKEDPRNQDTVSAAQPGPRNMRPLLVSL